MWDFRRIKALTRLCVADTNLDKLPFSSTTPEIVDAYKEVLLALNEYHEAIEQAGRGAWLDTSIPKGA